MSSQLAPELTVVFVCTGNICRSPMAEVMAREALTLAGLDERVRVCSAGTGGWHQGSKMDHRAAAELARLGLPVAHRASELTATDLKADLLVALDRGHASHLLRVGVPKDRIRLLRTFDSDAHGDDVDDPYYGGPTDFARTRGAIEGALPGLIAYLRSRLAEPNRGEPGR